MLSRTRDFLQQVFGDFSQDECSSMAAALAYTTLFALPSMLLIIIYVAGLVLGPRAASGEIESRLSGAMGMQAAAEIQQMVANIARNRTGGIIATLAGTAGLILSATGLLVQLQTCLNRAWKVTAVGGGFKTFVMRRLRSGLLLGGAGLMAIISVTASSIISGVTKMLPFASLVQVGELATSLLIFVVVFAGILKVMPDVKLRWGDVWVGGLFIAALFVGGKFLIGLYLGRAGKTSIYGAAGSLAIILLWTYYSFLIFLLGVEFTQVWVRRDGREIVPKDGAVLTTARYRLEQANP
ncbi:MAG TPA: YihY/virulence factor BrkB family protein [Candidatus Binataceae bacterium]|nr:YihY/virulence factor BrkB family protein [Candidatus Binataceae bacterium]